MELDPLIEKIIETIRKDVQQIFTKTSGTGPLCPDHQESLCRYYKLLTDHKLAVKERELEEKLKRAEEILNRGTAKTP